MDIDKIYIGCTNQQLKDRSNIKIVDSGEIFGFNYYILTMGGYPCAYIEIPKEHELFGKHYNDSVYYKYDGCVNGGFTFSSNHLNCVCEQDNKNRWFIGWDYAHAGDYVYYNKKMYLDGKKWTVHEIKGEIYDLCERLKNK